METGAASTPSVDVCAASTPSMDGLLYTTDAADALLCVIFAGHRPIGKKIVGSSSVQKKTPVLV